MKGRRDTGKKRIMCTEGPAFEKDLDLKHGGVKKEVDGVEMKPGGETRLAVKEEDTKGRSKNKNKEKTRWEVVPEYFQFLALHWHTVTTTHPHLDGSQVQQKIWKKWVRGETPKRVRPKVKEVRTKESVEVLFFFSFSLNCLIGDNEGTACRWLLLMRSRGRERRTILSLPYAINEQQI